MPTPPAAPLISTRSPIRRPRLREERVVRGREDLGQPARRQRLDGVRDRHRLALVHGAQLALTAAADDRHHAVADGEALGARAERDDVAGELEPGDVGRRAGRSRVRAAALEHVGAVEAGGAHADEHLAVPGLGIGMVGDEHLAVADRGGTHGGETYVPGRVDAAPRHRRPPAAGPAGAPRRSRRRARPRRSPSAVIRARRSSSSSAAARMSARASSSESPLARRMSWAVMRAWPTTRLTERLRVSSSPEVAAAAALQRRLLRRVALGRVGERHRRGAVRRRRARAARRSPRAGRGPRAAPRARRRGRARRRRAGPARPGSARGCSARRCRAGRGGSGPRRAVSPLVSIATRMSARCASSARARRSASVAAPSSSDSSASATASITSPSRETAGSSAPAASFTGLTGNSTRLKTSAMLAPIRTSTNRESPGAIARGSRAPRSARRRWPPGSRRAGRRRGRPRR